MAISAENETFALTLIDGAERAFKNAGDLFREAQVLAIHGAVARAFFLHQISLEECGKIEMIPAAISNLLAGGDVDMKRLKRAFARHESKNKMNAYFLPRTVQEEAALESKDVSAAAGAFNALQSEFHTSSNTLKNASLYVDFDQKFSSPSDAITTDLLSEILERNAKFLTLTKVKIDVLSRWRQNLDAAAGELAEMSKALGLDNLKRGDPESMTAFMESLRAKILTFVQGADAYPAANSPDATKGKESK